MLLLFPVSGTHAAHYPCRSFQFHGLRVDESLRAFLETFRLPGESPVIEHIVEFFSELVYVRALLSFDLTVWDWACRIEPVETFVKITLIFGSRAQGLNSRKGVFYLYLLKAHNKFYIFPKQTFDV